MRTIPSCVFAVLVVCTLSADDKKDEKIDAQKLIGKWEPKEELDKGRKFTMEFGKDGKVVITRTVGEQKARFEGTYKLDGNKLTQTVKDGGKERSDTVTITKLTDSELLIITAKGTDFALVRIKDK
jgi:uncharacterized protein (TIGR03066 family)